MTEDLVQFLRARLDEDAERQQGTEAWHHRDCESLPDGDYPTFACNCGVPARVLAEVDAKRRLLTVHKRDTTYSFSRCITCDAGDNSCGCMGGSAYDYPCETLRILALPYAAHPDYRPKWAPDPT